MTSRELFQVLLRFMGVWLLYRGAYSLFTMLYYMVQSGFSSEIVGDLLAQATPQLLLGLYLLSGAGWLVRHCYGASDAKTD